MSNSNARKTPRTPQQAREAARRVTAPDGGPIVLVPVPGSLDPVTVDEADYDLILSHGFSPTWFLNGVGAKYRYVRTHRRASVGATNNVQVARLVVPEVPRGCVIKYADGNRLNLRRANLMVVPQASRAKGRERRWMAEDAPLASCAAA